MPSRILTCMACAIGLCGIVACSSTPPTPTEYLDRNTGATVTSSSQPFLFSRSERTTDLRQLELDYITLAAVDVNRNGNHELLLLAYFWTTLQSDAPRRGPLPLRLLIDGQALELAPDSRSARDCGIATLPHRPPGGFTAEPVMYRSDAITWQRMAQAGKLNIELAAPAGAVDTTPLLYEIWTDGAAALRALLTTLQLP